MAAHVWAAALALLFVFCVSSGSSPLKYEDDLHAVLSALEKLVTYYKENFMSLNLDGFFGLRVLEGQLQLLITEHEAGLHKHISPDIFNNITSLKKAAQDAGNVGMDFVKRDDSKYFKEFSRVVESPWLMMKPHRKLQPSLRWEIPQYKAKAKTRLSEELSDRCMKELMQGGSQGCPISEQCANVMTSRGLTGYGITHQLLWTILGEIMPNCSASVNKAIFEQDLGNISQLQLEFCTNNFYEMVAVAHVLMHGKIHESHQDLFLEQQFVCPNLGFYEFMKKDYLDQILTWQFPSGCFGELEEPNEDEDFNVATLLESYHENGEKLLPEVRKIGKPGSLVESMIINEPSEIKKAKNVDGQIVQSISENKQNFYNAPPLQAPQKTVLEGTVLRVPRHVVMRSANKTLHHFGSDSLQPPSKVKLTSNGQWGVMKSTGPLKGKTSAQMKSDQTTKFRTENIQGVVRNATPVAANSNHSFVHLHNSQSKPEISTSLSSNSFVSKQNQGSLMYNTEKPNLLTSQRHFYKMENNHVGGMKRGGIRPQDSRTGRRLLVEKEMAGGCLSHKTGVGAGALVMYLRYLVDPGDIKWTGQHELFLSDTRDLLQAQMEGAAGDIDDGEEEEEEDEEAEEDDNGIINDDMTYADDDEGDEAADDEEEDAYNQEEDEDYDDENADEGEADVGEDDPVIRFGASRRSDTIVINEDGEERDAVDYANVDRKVVLNDHLQLPKQAIVDVDGEADQEEDHNYYDDEGETERGIIKRRKPPTPRPHPPIKTRRKHSGNAVSQEHLYGVGQEMLIPDQPNYVVILLVSVAPFFVLFFFLFRFIRKRRVHIRYYF